MSEQIPKKITIDGVEVQANCLSSVVTLRENKIWDAVLIANDLEGETFLDAANIGDEVKIYYWVSSAWQLRFNGFVVELNPELSVRNEICAIKAYGYGIALKRMRVANEYGTESLNPTLDTLREILTDASEGVVPKYVLKLLKTAVDSGYALNTDYAYNDTTSHKYILSPFAPATWVLKTVLELVSASEYPDAGLHWTTIPNDAGDPFLCVAPVGNHNVIGKAGFNVSTKWATYADPNQIEVAKEMIHTRFSKLESEANCIVYMGIFEHPCGEIWTEETTGWINFGLDSITKVAALKRGTGAIRFDAPVAGYGIGYRALPATLDFTKIGTRDSLPTISFFANLESEGLYNIALYDGDPDDGAYNGKFVLPLGAVHLDTGTFFFELKAGDFAENEGWVESGSPNWNHITHIGFEVDSSAVHLDVDDLRITGLLTRVAYNSTVIAAQNGAKIKLVVDDLAKSDSLEASDDSGVMAQLAKAELIRAQTTPLIGAISITLAPNVWAGQLIRVKYPRNANFPVDDGQTYYTMRIMEVQDSHSVDGAISIVTVIDDLKNSYCLEPKNAYNAVMKAVNPDFQDRDRGTFKGRDIDIDQTITQQF